MLYNNQIENAQKYLSFEESEEYCKKDSINIIFESNNIDLLEKVYALDKVYGCNLNLSQTGYVELCKRLESFNQKIRNTEDYSEANNIVKEIATIQYKNNIIKKGILSEKEQKEPRKNRHIGLVFSSKYCYFTNISDGKDNDIFIIYDKYANIAINYFKDKENPTYKPKYNTENYDKYAEEVRELLYKVNKFTTTQYRSLDKYLWLFGQVLEAENGQKKRLTRINYILEKYKFDSISDLKNNLDISNIL